MAGTWVGRRHLAAPLGDTCPSRRGELRAASIGAVTSVALREAGVEPAAEAPEASDDGLVATLLAAAGDAG